MNKELQSLIKDYKVDYELGIYSRKEIKFIFEGMIAIAKTQNDKELKLFLVKSYRSIVG